ncbi:MAG: hypothetical protein HYV14_04580 [Elusimicrobia bacterium]|nr:hypothetical protein [Elusimicrobiota bacterium]
MPTKVFAGYLAACFLCGELFPFARLDMFSSAGAGIRVVVVRADGAPLELAELASFSADPPPFAAAELPSADMRDYLSAFSAERAAPSAAHAFLDVETGLGRNRSVHEALFRYARWRRSPPVLETTPSRVEISEESVEYDRAGRGLKRASRLLWRGTARRIR